jgi:uncharacterized NAD(P)/FAD-binding protein YdhS
MTSRTPPQGGQDMFIRYTVRCCTRRGLDWAGTLAVVRRRYGWFLHRDVVARREWLRHSAPE